MDKTKLHKTEDDWKKILSKEEFNILRKKGTEHPFSGKYVSQKEKGTYVCAGCGQKLFSSEAKFDSGSGWPSFYQPLSNDSVETKKDKSVGMVRTEVLCSRCDGHLGHVFEDGPKPTKLRFCINSTSLRFIK